MIPLDVGDAMSNPLAAFCDDFYINMRLGSQMPLPTQRETVLHFCEMLQKAFPGLTRFRSSDVGDVSLEEDRAGNSYRWMSIEHRRLCSGHVNPPGLVEAMRLHQLILELAPHQLGLSPLEIDYLDVLFGFDLDFTGNHDEIIAESLLSDSPLLCLNEIPGTKPMDIQPSITVALSEDCRLQARLEVVTRTNSYQVRTGEYTEEAISVYLIVRRYWGDRPRKPMEKLVMDLAMKGQELCESYIVPRILKPIAAAISSRS